MCERYLRPAARRGGGERVECRAMAKARGDEPTIQTRASGVLLHPTSLRGHAGVGDLGPGAHRFLGWLRSAGQSIWQILPFNEPGYAYSPYGAASSYAGSHFLISLEALVEDGLLASGDLATAPDTTPGRVDYEAVRRFKEGALRQAWSGFGQHSDSPLRGAFERFVERENHHGWLDDWSLYVALKKKSGNASWQEWPPELRQRRPQALAAARTEQRQEIEYERFVQFLFYRQWETLHVAAREAGVSILGDLPIYPAPDSADVWASQEIFDLDSEGRLRALAGRPTTSAPPVSSGAIRSTAGAGSPIGTSTGGSGASSSFCATSTSCASITSAASAPIGGFRAMPRTLAVASGWRPPAPSSSRRCAASSGRCPWSPKTSGSSLPTSWPCASASGCRV